MTDRRVAADAAESNSTLPRRPLLWTARSGWVLVLLFVMAVLAANLPYVVQDTQNAWQTGGAWPFARQLFATRDAFARWLVAGRLLSGLVFFGTALLLAWRKWRDAVVLLFSADLLLLGLFYSLSFNTDIVRYPAPIALWLPNPGGVSVLLIGGAMLTLFYLFPDGAIRPRRLAWVQLPAGVNALAWMILFGFPELTRLIEARFPALRDAVQVGWYWFVGSMLAALVAGLAGQAARYVWVSSATQRQQTKWAILGLVVLVAVPFGSYLLAVLLGIAETPIGHFIQLHLEFAMAILPLTIAFSVLRYRLWEVDFWLNRTLVYGALTGAIILAYVLVVGVLSRAFATSDADFAHLLALLATLLMAWPLYGRLNAAVSHRLPGALTPPAAAAGGHGPVPSPSPLVRAGQAGWLAALALLLQQLLAALGNWEQTVQRAGHEWIVTSGYPLVARWLSAEAYAAYYVALALLVAAGLMATAGLIFWKRRHDGMALFVSLTLLLLAFGSGGGATARAETLGVAGLLLLILLFFIFPDGRFVPRSGRNRALLLALLLLTPFVAGALLRARFSGPADVEWVGYVTLMIALGVTMAAGIASQIARYWREHDPARRQQQKWVLFGFGLQLTWIGWLLAWLLVQSWVPLDDPLFSVVVVHLVTVAPLAFALTLGFAILRYRLWDIDMIARRALVYGALTTLVVLAYVLAVGVLGQLLRGDSVWLAVITTGAVALAINPLRDWLQKRVNRLLYGEQDDPVRLLARLGAQLEAAVDADALLPTLVQTTATALKLPYVAVQLDGTAAPVAAAGTPGGRLETWPLLYQGEAIGRFHAARRAPTEPFTPREQRLLASIAQQAGAAAHAVQLSAAVRRSRQRLVVAREEERRRLRRDLHDGLGPQLATLTLQIDAARNLLRHDPAAADAQLRQLKRGAQGAIAEIRRVVHELRPPALDQLGLVEAIRQHAAGGQHNGLTVTVEPPPDLPHLPAAVEVAAYRIAIEALTNAARHAHATRCSVQLRVADGALELTVADDGVGLAADFQPGVGLASMRERATELGGTLSVQGRDGVTVVAVLPLET